MCFFWDLPHSDKLNLNMEQDERLDEDDLLKGPRPHNGWSIGQLYTRIR